jgi:hypothetical protein
MTVATRWIHKIDGTELNDASLFVCTVPEAEADFGAAVLLTDMQARTPVFNRQQPTPGRFTFLITSLNFMDPTLGPANLATLKALVAPGVHTYTRARPGETDTGKSVAVYFDAGLVVDTETGHCTAKAIAPDPTWT